MNSISLHGQVKFSVSTNPLILFNLIVSQIKRCLLLGRKVMTNLDSILKKQRHYFANKGPSGQGYGFSSGHVWM